MQQLPYPLPPPPSTPPTSGPSAAPNDATDARPGIDAPFARELFVPEVFTRDNLPEHLTNSELQRSISHLGDLERLHCFLEKIRAGRNVSVGVVGGSVSAGSSSMVRTDQGGLFHKKMQGWLQQRFPGAHVTHFNAAMPAVPPDYMQHCVRLHVPQDADLIFLEAAANMCGPTDKHGVDQCQEGRASVERILRQLLRFPNAPAVVLVHAYPYWTMRTPRAGQKGFRRKTSARQAACRDPVAGRVKVPVPAGGGDPEPNPGPNLAPTPNLPLTGVPAKIPWLVPRISTSSSTSSGDAPDPTRTRTLTRTRTRTLTRARAPSPSLTGGATPRTAHGRRARRYTPPGAGLGLGLGHPFSTRAPARASAALCPPSRCVTSCGTG